MTYTLANADAGAKVRAKVTATNPDGSTDAYSSAVGPVLATPLNLAAPGITGTLTDASILTADPGTWLSAGNLPHTYRYQWVRCPARRDRRRLAGLRGPARSEQPDLHHGGRRRRVDDRRAGHGHQHRQRVRDGGLAGHRSGRRPRADELGRPVDLGRDRGPLDPHRERRD